MKKTLKQTLILAVMVLCMLALFTVATSAATYTDDSAAIAGGAVARIGAAGSGTYYASVGEALEAVPENGTEPTEITLIANATWSNISLQDKAVTFKGANNDVVLTMNTPAELRSNSSVAFENLKIFVAKNETDFLKLYNSITSIKFKNCEISASAPVNFFRTTGWSASVDTLQLSNVTFSTPGIYFIAIGGGGTQTFGSETNPVLLENLTGSFGYALYNKNGTNLTIHLKVVGSEFSGAIDDFNGTTVCDDAFAKQLGYKYRVGDTAEGQVNVVYFKTKDEAILRGEGGKNVYDITKASPEKVAEICDHTLVSTVVAPTCDKDGYTEHKCSKCNMSRTDTPVEALGHKYSKATCIAKSKCSVCGVETGELARHKYEMATCTKKSTCSGCGVERGELAKHADLDKNGKCDKCDAKMAADAATTTTAAADSATEEKKGCGGTVSVAGLALVAALGSCALFVEKKRK